MSFEYLRGWKKNMYCCLPSTLFLFQLSISIDKSTFLLKNSPSLLQSCNLSGRLSVIGCGWDMIQYRLVRASDLLTTVIIGPVLVIRPSFASVIPYYCFLTESWLRRAFSFSVVKLTRDKHKVVRIHILYQQEKVSLPWERINLALKATKKSSKSTPERSYNPCFQSSPAIPISVLKSITFTFV